MLVFQHAVRQNPVLRLASVEQTIHTHGPKVVWYLLNLPIFSPCIQGFSVDPGCSVLPLISVNVCASLTVFPDTRQSTAIQPPSPQAHSRWLIASNVHVACSHSLHSDVRLHSALCSAHIAMCDVRFLPQEKYHLNGVLWKALDERGLQINRYRLRGWFCYIAVYHLRLVTSVGICKGFFYHFNRP